MENFGDSTQEFSGTLRITKKSENTFTSILLLSNHIPGAYSQASVILGLAPVLVASYVSRKFVSWVPLTICVKE